MTSLGNILLEKEILLESGTNEVEILVFRVGELALGINVAKVREVLPAQKIAHLPQAHPSVTWGTTTGFQFSLPPHCRFNQ